MSSEWSYPKDSEDTLYISQADTPCSFGDLFYRIRLHFGDACQLNQFDIEYERWTHESGCSCCRDSGTYGDFWKVTRRATPDPECAAVLISTLTEGAKEPCSRECH